MENFNLKKFLVENKLTTNSKMLNEKNISGTQEYTYTPDNERSEMKKSVFDLFAQLTSEVCDGKKQYYFLHGNGGTGHFLPSKGTMVYKDKKNIVYFYDDIDVPLGDPKKKNSPESTLYIITKQHYYNLPLDNSPNRARAASYYRELCGEALSETFNRKVDNVEYN